MTEAKAGPILSALIADGAAYIDGVDVIGIAADGTEVSLGNTFTFAATEAYLTDYPTPTDW